MGVDLGGGMQITTGGSKVSPAVKALLTLVASLLLVSGFSMGTWSAFNAVKTNSGNSFAAGTVLLSDNDSGNAMMSLVSAKPFDSVSACLVVTYTGTLSGTVRLYGSTTGTGLAQYLNLTITRGTMGLL
jgi:predicted ribosomally synthesized peptide with SipW-like signal peptide